MTQPTNITASAITIVDQNGKPRIVLGTSPDNAAIFSILDSRGYERINIGVRESGDAFVTLKDEGENANVQLRCEAEEGSAVSIRSANRASGIAMHFIQSTGFPAIVMCGPVAGANAVAIGFGPDGNPLVSGTDSVGLKTFKID